MKLPMADNVVLGQTAYESFQAKEGLPVIRGYFVEDLRTVAVKPWKRMGALGCYLNLGGQEDTDAYVCEIPPVGQTEPQRHLFEVLIYIATGHGATTIWHRPESKQTFEWSAGAFFAIPLNVSYQHFNASGSTFHRHGPGAVICVTQGTGFAMTWREDEPRQRFEIGPGSIYSPGDLMFHAHFNTGNTKMRHIAMRGQNPKYFQSRYRTSLHYMIPFDEEPPEIQREYLQALAENGVQTEVQIFND
jgi:hypothetical protein